MSYSLYMTIKESSQLHLFIKRLQADNVFIPIDIINNWKLLNQSLKTPRLKDAAIVSARKKIKNIYKALFEFFSGMIADKEIELYQRGRVDLLQGVDDTAVTNIYWIFVTAKANAEYQLKKMDVLGALGHSKVLINYERAISDVLEQLYVFVNSKKALYQASDVWQMVEIDRYFNSIDTDLLIGLLKISTSDFSEKYQAIITANRVNEKKYRIAFLYQQVIKELIDNIQPVLQDKRKNILDLLSKLRDAQRQLKKNDTTPMTDEIKKMSSSLKIALQGLDSILSPSLSTGLYLAKKQAYASFDKLTIVNLSSAAPIFDQYRHYQRYVFALFTGKPCNLFLSENDYHLMSKKTDDFLTILSSTAQTSLELNQHISEPVRIKSPNLKQGISNSFFLGTIKVGDHDKKEQALPSISKQPSNLNKR
ncbi:MAG: hypothetical protein WAW86_01170 [Gammaproteobacteria bacterium]